MNKDGSFVIDSTPEYCKKACVKSLQRLGIDTIDLYYCHRVDQETPIEKTVEAMVELKKLVLPPTLWEIVAANSSLARARLSTSVSAKSLARRSAAPVKSTTSTPCKSNTPHLPLTSKTRTLD